MRELVGGARVRHSPHMQHQHAHSAASTRQGLLAPPCIRVRHMHNAGAAAYETNDLERLALSTPTRPRLPSPPLPDHLASLPFSHQGAASSSCGRCSTTCCLWPQTAWAASTRSCGRRTSKRTRCERGRRRRCPLLGTARQLASGEGCRTMPVYHGVAGVGQKGGPTWPASGAPGWAGVETRVSGVVWDGRLVMGRGSNSSNSTRSNTILQLRGCKVIVGRNSVLRERIGGVRGRRQPRQQRRRQQQQQQRPSRLSCPQERLGLPGAVG